MAQAVAAIVIKAAGASLSTGAAAAITAAAAVTDIAIAASYQKKQEADARKAAAAAPRDVMVRSAIEPAKIVYGRARVSGPVVYTNTVPTAGTNDNNTLWTVVSLASHECADIEAIYLDGDKIPSSIIDWAGTGGVTSGTYGPIGGNEVTNFYRRLGSDSQTHVTQLATAFSDWTADHDGRGICYVVSAFELGTKTGEGVWANGAPQNIRAVVKGKKVYDPRLDSTNGGSGTHRLADPATWEWSDNPALCLADYLFDADIGMGAEGITYGDIDWAMVATAADQCDATVTVPSGGSTKRFTCNGALDTGTAYADNIRALLSSMAGTLTWSGGKYRIRACAYEAPTYTFTENDIVGDVQIQPERPRAQRFNTVRGTFIDPGKDYAATQFLRVQDSDYLTTRDSGQELTTSISLPMTNDEFMAQRLAYKSLRLNNQQITAVLPVNWKALKVGVGERISVTIAELSWSAKVFVVDAWSFDPENGFSLTVREDSASAYTDPALGDYSTRTAAGTIVFNDPAVPSPSGLTATGEEEGVLLEWEAPSMPSMYDEVVVYASPDSAWANAVEVGRVRGTRFRHELLRGLERFYWVRSEDVDGRESVRDPDSDTSTISATAGASTAVIGGAGVSTIVDFGGNPVLEDDLLNEYNAGKTIALLLNQDSDGSTFNGNGAFVGVSNAGDPVTGTDGFFIWNGIKYTVDRSYLGNYTFVTSMQGRQGYIVYDISTQTPFAISGFGNSRIAFVWKEGGQWYYDNDNFTGVAFNPTDTMLALAYLNKDSTTQFISKAGLLAEPVQIVAVADITADYISVGTLDASVVNVTNLNADEITTGSLSADFITIDGVTLDTDGAGTLIVKNNGIDTGQLANGAVTAPIVAEGAVQGKTIALLLNKNSDATGNSGEGSFVGVNNAGEPVPGTDGFVIFDNVKYNIARTQLSSSSFATQLVNKKGYVVYDASGLNFTVQGIATRTAFVFREGATWHYDNNAVAVAFTPTDSMLALAYIETGSADVIQRGGLLAEPIQLLQISEIRADYISAGTLDASLVNVTNLNASNITTGTLDAGVVTVSNLNASNITSGTLNAGVVSVTNLNADNITTGTLSASNIQLDDVTLTASGGNLIVKSGGVNTNQLALRSATDTFRADMPSDINYSTSWTTLVSITGQQYNGNDIAEISWGIRAHPEAAGAPYIAIRILIYAGASLQATQYFIGDVAYDTTNWAQIQQALFSSSMQYFVGFTNSNWQFYLQAATNVTDTFPRTFRAPGTYMQIVRLKR